MPCLMSSPFKGDVANVQRMIEGSKEVKKEGKRECTTTLTNS